MGVHNLGTLTTGGLAMKIFSTTLHQCQEVMMPLEKISVV